MNRMMMMWMTFQSRWTLIRVMISNLIKRPLRAISSLEKGVSK
jgi:hypothetical protein